MLFSGNDNPPRFASDRLRFYVPENSPIGSVVGELRATDADEGQNARIEYTIVGGPDMKWFTLKPGAITATSGESTTPTSSSSTTASSTTTTTPSSSSTSSSTSL